MAPGFTSFSLSWSLTVSQDRTILLHHESHQVFHKLPAHCDKTSEKWVLSQTNGGVGVMLQWPQLGRHLKSSQKNFGNIKAWHLCTRKKWIKARTKKGRHLSPIMKKEGLIPEFNTERYSMQGYVRVMMQTLSHDWNFPTPSLSRRFVGKKKVDHSYSSQSADADGGKGSLCGVHSAQGSSGSCILQALLHFAEQNTHMGKDAWSVRVEEIWSINQKTRPNSWVSTDLWLCYWLGADWQ